MAKFNSVTIGKGSGKIGNVVLTTWKGINVAKSLQSSVANPRSKGQIEQRSVFTAMVSLFGQLGVIFTMGFRQRAVKKSGYNAFVSKNLKNGAFTSDLGNLTFIKQNFVPADGTMSDTPILVSAFNAGNSTLSVEWDPNPQAGQNDADRAYALIVDPLGQYAYASAGNADRASNNTSISLSGKPFNSGLSGVYLFFVNEITGEVSKSSFSTVTIP